MKDSERQINKPYPSTAKGKKYSVIVMYQGKRKKLNFGAKGMDDWRSGTATKEQRKSYKARASGIKNGQGQLTYKLKHTANYWSYNYLW